MKKLLIIMIFFMLILTGCKSTKYDEQYAKELKEEIKALKSERNDLEKIIIDTKIEKGVAEYILTISIGQKHHNFDIDDMIKDSMNKTDIQIPTSKEFYDSVQIGTILDDSFRNGSFYTSGSIGSWDIKVINKEIR